MEAKAKQRKHVFKQKTLFKHVFKTPDSSTTSLDRVAVKSSSWIPPEGRSQLPIPCQPIPCQPIPWQPIPCHPHPNPAH